MQIHELSTDTRLWQAICAEQQASSEARAKGLHLSTITNDIAATVYPKEFWYLVRNSETPPEYDERTRATFEAGHVIEEIIAQHMAKRAGWAKPEPRQVQSIWCSPDGYNARTRTIDEMKVTWKSSRDFRSTPKWQLIVWQVLGYVYAFEAERIRVHVMHMNGDWRPPRPEPPKTYIIRPSPREIAETWAMVVTHAKDRGWLQTKR